jgi:hypothetical protein
MDDTLKLPVSMSVDQMLELILKSNGKISFTVKLNENRDVSCVDSDFDGEPGCVDDIVDHIAKKPESPKPTKHKLKDALLKNDKVPSWWATIEDEEIIDKSYNSKRKLKKGSRLDKILKFRKLKLGIKPVVGRGSRQALWDCPISNFPDTVLSSALKDFMTIHDLNTIRNVTILTKEDMFNKLSKYFDSETCKSAMKEINKALKVAGLKFFYSVNKDDNLDNV